MTLAPAPSALLGVLSLFVVPIGGGIPAGVLLARAHSIGWPVMMALYFISDVILACVFEPVMRFLIKAGRKSPRMSRFIGVMKTMVHKTIAYYGSTGGPFALIMIAFGVDPMTGRAATHAAGHGFISGWALAIAGDMIYFTVIMASTLWLNSILGDGTRATVIILITMLVLPALIRLRRKPAH